MKSYVLRGGGQHILPTLHQIETLLSLLAVPKQNHMYRMHSIPINLEEPISYMQNPTIVGFLNFIT